MKSNKIRTTKNQPCLLCLAEETLKRKTDDGQEEEKSSDAVPEKRLKTAVEVVEEPTSVVVEEADKEPEEATA